MENQLLSLNELLKKYKSEKENLEKQIKEKTEKIKIVYDALTLLEQEGVMPDIQESSTANRAIVSLNDKYKGMSMNKAIIDVLSNSEKYLSGIEIYNELLKNGFSSGSSDIKRDVFISVYRLEKNFKIISRDIENLKKYMIKQDS